MENNTVFDDVYRTMLEKLPRLAVPLINEVFHTSYEDDVEIQQMRNEHHTKSGEIITDSCLVIQGKSYHMECQSTPDSSMIIRMVEYDFQIALEGARKEEDHYIMEFPKACVLYLRHTERTREHIEVEIRLSDETTVIYQVPVIKVQKYTKDEIFQKKLLFLLPFYIMRYEKEAAKLEQNEEKLAGLLDEYKDIRCRLEQAVTGTEKSRIYSALAELIVRISDYILRTAENAKKGVGEVMGGKVLELKSEKIWEAGKQEGRQEGWQEGEREKGLEIAKNLKSTGLSDEAIAMATGVELDIVKKL